MSRLLPHLKRHRRSPVDAALDRSGRHRSAGGGWFETGDNDWADQREVDVSAGGDLQHLRFGRFCF